MSLGGHLDELRGRLGKALGGFAVAFFASLSAGKWFAGVILSPYKAAMESAGIQVRRQAVQPAEPFLVYMKASLVLALLISSPWVFHQLWAFVSAGLHKHERRFVRIVAPACASLFAGGVLFFLLAIAPWVFRFFMQFDLGIDYLTYPPGGWARRRTSFLLWRWSLGWPSKPRWPSCLPRGWDSWRWNR